MGRVGFHTSQVSATTVITKRVVGSWEAGTPWGMPFQRERTRCRCSSKGVLFGGTALRPTAYDTVVPRQIHPRSAPGGQAGPCPVLRRLQLGPRFLRSTRSFVSRSNDLPFHANPDFRVSRQGSKSIFIAFPCRSEYSLKIPNAFAFARNHKVETAAEEQQKCDHSERSKCSYSYAFLFFAVENDDYAGVRVCPGLPAACLSVGCLVWNSTNYGIL
eukprot:scaffold5519_cov166-Amphora_coffeaeformis.AAC.4